MAAGVAAGAVFVFMPSGPVPEELFRNVCRAVRRVPFFGIHHAKGQHPAAPPRFPAFFPILAHRQGNALAGDVHVEHGDEHFLMHFDDFVGIAHEAVRQLADVDEPVLMHADVHKRAERCDIVTMPGSFMPCLRSCSCSRLRQRKRA